MKPFIYDMTCIDHMTQNDVCLEDFLPPIKTSFALGIKLYVKYGDENDTVSIFYIDVITPQSSEFFFNNYFNTFPHNLSFVKSLIICNGEYDGKKIKEAIYSYVYSSRMKTIDETLVMLGRYLEDEETGTFGSKDYYLYLINSLRKNK